METMLATVQTEPMPSAIESQPVEDRAGALSRMREMAVNAWETVSRNPKEKLAILLASVACEQAAELALNPTPAKAGVGNPYQVCVKRPKIFGAKLFLNHGKTESFSSSEEFPDLTGEQFQACADTRRLAQRKLQVKQGNTWVTITRNPSWTPFLYHGWGGVTDTQSREARHTGLNLTLVARNEPKKFMAGCHSKAREEIRIQAQNTTTGDIEAQRTMTHPFKILKKGTVCKKH